MSTPNGLQHRADVLSVHATLANMLDVLDHRPRGAHAAQYRAVAASLAHVLTTLDQDTLDALLARSPAACELYENQHYAHAGLCRSDLDLSLKAEFLAKEALQKAAKRAA
jgi:hypothetical protein